MKLNILKKIANWIRYSGASVIFTVNPVHWRWLPRVKDESSREWPDGYSASISWLFLTLRVWADNGDW
jgi:hypothetical protein